MGNRNRRRILWKIMKSKFPFNHFKPWDAGLMHCVWARELVIAAPPLLINYDALVILGGRAAMYLALDENVLALVTGFMASNKPIASLSYGHLILAAANVVELDIVILMPTNLLFRGKRCTGCSAVRLDMILSRATWVEVEPGGIGNWLTDGNLLTGTDWEVHPEFISQLMALLGINVTFAR